MTASAAPTRGRADDPRPRAPRGGEWAVRRDIDVLVAVVVLLLTALVLAGIALWIRLETPGPALFRQERIGRAGVPFRLYKFRTMRISTDDAAHRALIAAELRGEATCSGGSTKIDDDPRVTRSGRFLRRTSLDEVPQLLNVLRGEMTLVGPRPCLDWEAAMFPREYAARFDVLPGLTGLWQVRGRSTLGTLDMLRLDLEYVRDQRLGRDLAILALTIPSLLRGDGAR